MNVKFSTKNSTGERLLLFAQKKTGKKHGAQKELAEMLGISTPTLSPYIKGHIKPGNEMQEKLRSIGCDIEWLMTGHESKSSAWKGLDMEVVGTKDPPKGTMADVMLSPAHCGDAAEIFEGVAAQIDIAKYHNEHTFYVVARGESMTGFGIEEGDMLLIDVEREPKNGNIVLVRIADKVSVKRLKKNGEEALLTPENPEYEPIPLSKDVRVLAVVLRAEKWFI